MACPQTTARESLSERLFDATIQTLELYGVYLGKRLGLYEQLRDSGPLTAPELAARAGIDARYAREWLEQQAVADILFVDDPALAAESRRYSLPSAYAAVLADDEHPAYVAPFAEMLVGVAAALPQVVEAYRSGAGVPFGDYGADLRNGQAGINKPAFLHDLTSVWLPAVPDVHARLGSAPAARIADVGCGVGWSTIALARAYPEAVVIGYDLDTASIADAEVNAASRGVSVRFERKDASEMAADGPFDLILVLEALHDMARPAEVLAELRRALRPDGCIIVADERVAERFSAPGDAIERMMYGWSTVHCLPAARVEAFSQATGTALRPDTVRACAAEAGFGTCDVLPIDHDLFRFYRLEGGQ